MEINANVVIIIAVLLLLVISIQRSGESYKIILIGIIALIIWIFMTQQKVQVQGFAHIEFCDEEIERKPRFRPRRIFD